MDPWAYVRVKRLVLCLVFAYFAWPLLPNIIAYGRVVRDSSRQVQTAKVAPSTAPPSVPSSSEIARTLQGVKQDAAKKQASIGKLTARKLESQLVQKKIVSAAARIHCDPVASNWDYVCSYLATPKTTSTRVQFGVEVDKESWVQISTIVPEGTNLPMPSK